MRLSKWTKSSIGSVAMGHEIMVTTAQLAQALAVIANGGRLVPPKMVRKVIPMQSEGVPLRKTSYEVPAAQLRGESQDGFLVAATTVFVSYRRHAGT